MNPKLMDEGVHSSVKRVLVFIGILCCSALPTFAAFLVIDGALGIQSREIPGIESMNQGDVAKEAALFALSSDGWNLEEYGGYLNEYGPSTGWGGRY